MAAIKYIFYPGANAVGITLGDDSVGETVSGGLPEFDPQTELVMFGNAQFARLIEHGNGIHSMSWLVDRNHTSEIVAAQFRLEHPQSIPVVMGVAVGVLEEKLGTGQSRFFQNCSRPKMRCVRWDGASTVFEYSIQFGKVTKTRNP